MVRREGVRQNLVLLMTKAHLQELRLQSKARVHALRSPSIVLESCQGPGRNGNVISLKACCSSSKKQLSFSRKSRNPNCARCNRSFLVNLHACLHADAYQYLVRIKEAFDSRPIWGALLEFESFPFVAYTLAQQHNRPNCSSSEVRNPKQTARFFMVVKD